MQQSMKKQISSRVKELKKSLVKQRDEFGLAGKEFIEGLKMFDEDSGTTNDQFRLKMKLIQDDIEDILNPPKAIEEDIHEHDGVELPDGEVHEEHKEVERNPDEHKTNSAEVSKKPDQVSTS
jgi:hypothetical protein